MERPTTHERQYSSEKFNANTLYQSQKMSEKNVSPKYSPIKNNQNYLCTKVDHDNNPLNLVCIDQACPRRGLICTHCMHYEHKNHKTMPLKIFIDTLFNLSSKNSQKSQNKLDIINLLNQQTYTLKLFDDLAAKIKDYSSKIKQNIAQYFLQDVQPFSNQDDAQAGCEQIVNQLRRGHMDQEEFHQNIDELASFIKSENFENDFIAPSTLPEQLRDLELKTKSLYESFNYELNQVYLECSENLKKLQQKYFEADQYNTPHQIIQQDLVIDNVFKVKIKNKQQCHQSIIWDAILIDDNQIATCSYDQSIKIFNLDDQKMVILLKGHTDEVYQLAYTQKNQFLASSSYDQNIILWKQSRNQFKLDKILKGHTGKTWAVCFLDSISKLASGGKNQTVIIWDIFTGNKDFIIRGQLEDTIWSLIGLKDGSTMISGDNQKLKFWDLQQMKLKHTVVAHTNRIYKIIEDDKNSLILSGSMDRTVKIWDTNNYQLIKTIQEISTVTSLIIIPQFQLVIIGMMDEELKGGMVIYSGNDFEKEKELQLFNQMAGVTSISWDNTLNKIITSHTDGKLCYTLLNRK